MSTKQLTHEPMLRSSILHRASEASRISHASRISRTSMIRREPRVGRPQEIKPKLRPKSVSSGLSNFSDLRSREGLTGKSYWQNIIDEVEYAVQCNTQPHIPLIDYSLVLPPALRKRVKHIQMYDYSKSDDDIFIREEMREERPQDYIDDSESDSENQSPKDEATLILEQSRKKVEEHFSESQHSDIVRMDQEFEKFDLKLDEPVGHTHRIADKSNWLAKFLSAPRDQRVTWQTRVERVGQTSTIRTLDEQAENLMDASAERFVEWLNGIGSGDATMTPEKIKNLFSIKGDRTLLASVRTDPKEVNAIAQTVADKWNKPHMAIELKYEKHINDHARRVMGKPVLSAFGRTVPMKDRPWTKRAGDTIIETVYPEELLTREKIFKGITHLRSTTALIDFYLNNPRLPRPQYLLEGGDFEQISASESLMEVPLYEYLGLRY